MFFCGCLPGGVVKKKKSNEPNELTRFLATLAENAEKSGNGIYDKIANNEELKKLRALDESFDDHIKSAVQVFLAHSFSELMTSICLQVALVLMEIKNQSDALKTDGEQPDMQKLEDMAAEAADKFRILADLAKRSAKSVDWAYVADTVTEIGKKMESGELKKADESAGGGFPFSTN